jgi:lipoprotein-anchoring transpeptidase ErfK/SrfK
MHNPIAYGDPKNPLGEYWLALSAPGHMGFGIHGTNEPHTMGTRASNGCVRMLNADVVELAGCVWKGMPVTSVD